MMWVILGHTFYTAAQTPFQNELAVYELGRRFSFQIVYSAFYAIDSFFFLSGFLVCYGYAYAVYGHCDINRHY